MLAASGMIFIGAYKAVEEVNKLFVNPKAPAESAEPVKLENEPNE